MITSPGMNPGKLDRRIALRYPTNTRDAGGGVVVTWVSAGDVWASWMPQPGREIQQAGQKVPLTVGTFRVRYRSTIAPSWRVVMDSVAYEITAPPIEVGRREYLDLIVRAIVGIVDEAVNVRLLHDSSSRLLHDDSLALLESAA